MAMVGFRACACITVSQYCAAKNISLQWIRSKLSMTVENVWQCQGGDKTFRLGWLLVRSNHSSVDIQVIVARAEAASEASATGGLKHTACWNAEAYGYNEQ